MTRAATGVVQTGVRGKPPRVAIVGVAESDLGYVPGKSPLDLQCEASIAALAEAGISRGEVDGVCAVRTGDTYASDSPALEVAEALGVQPRWIDSTLAGGTSSLLHVMSAAAAIWSGRASCVIVTYGSAQRSDRARRLAGWPTAAWLPESRFERPTGVLSPIGVAAFMARRHMHDYGTTAKQFAQVAVQSRAWASMNPKAARREPLSVAQVLDSPMVSSPLHTLDCCLISDGGGALVLTSPQRAADTASSPVTVLGYASLTTHQSVSQLPDLRLDGAGRTAAEALMNAGIGRADVQLVQVYDAFTILPIVLLEAMGFCGRGEGGAFVESGATLPTGSLPMNTQGGGLSYCHPGMFGIFLVIEAVHQLRGEAGERQVPNASIALCQAIGGNAASHATLVLGRGVNDD